MGHPDEFIDREAQLPRNAHILLLHGVRDGRRARQDPQIAAIGAADQCILILAIQRDHVIATVKRAKKGDFQRRSIRSAGEISFTLALVPFLFCLLYTSDAADE